MAGRRSPHAFSPLGELELKGLPEPVETLEVGWEPLGEVEAAASDRCRCRHASRSDRPTGVIGRDTEAELLADAFKRVAAARDARWS